MRYETPRIINTVAAGSIIQGAKQGLPGDSIDAVQRTNGAAYEADE